MLKIISTDDAPKAVGPYSQAVAIESSGFIFVSGQIPLHPSSMKVESTDVRGQTQQCLKNLLAVLRAAGASASSVVRTTVYLQDMNDFAAVNEEYERVFSEHKPARACVEVARLPKDVLVEIDAIAIRQK